VGFPPPLPLGAEKIGHFLGHKTEALFWSSGIISQAGLPDTVLNISDLILSYLRLSGFVGCLSDLLTIFNTASSAAPQIPTVLTDAGIEPTTVSTGALAVSRSNH